MLPRGMHITVKLTSLVHTFTLPHRTPLHCAVAYSNLEMIHYLLENGASLFLETRDGETPLKIGVEEYELSQEAVGHGEEVLSSVPAEECLKYLIGGSQLLVIPVIIKGSILDS